MRHVRHVHVCTPFHSLLGSVKLRHIAESYMYPMRTKLCTTMYTAGCAKQVECCRRPNDRKAYLRAAAHELDLLDTTAANVELGYCLCQIPGQCGGPGGSRGVSVVCRKTTCTECLHRAYGTTRCLSGMQEDHMH